MRTKIAAMMTASAAVFLFAAAKSPSDIAGSRLGMSKAEVLTNAATAPVNYGGVRQGLESVTYLVASSDVVLNEQGTEYGADIQTDDESKTRAEKASAGKSAAVTPVASQAELPAGTLTKSVYKTFYFDKFSRVVAIQMSFENLSKKDLDELLRALDEKYSKDIQKQTDVYTYSLSNFVKLECRVMGTAFRAIDNGRQQPIRFRVINLYYDMSRLKKTLRDVNERNTIRYKELI